MDSGICEIFACRIQNPRNFCLWNPESWSLESGKRLKESRIPLTTGIQNPSSSDKYWNQEPGIRNPRCEIQKPRLSWIPLHGANYGRDPFNQNFRKFRSKTQSIGSVQPENFPGRTGWNFGWMDRALDFRVTIRYILPTRVQRANAVIIRF